MDLSHYNKFKTQCHIRDNQETIEFINGIISANQEMDYEQEETLDRLISEIIELREHLNDIKNLEKNIKDGLTFLI